MKNSNRPHAITFTEPTLTKQSFKEECDINNIMLRYQRTGLVDHISKYQPQYHELDGSTYKDLMDKLANANSMFEELPSKARKHFDNDPAQFLDYVNNLQDGADIQQLIDLGLANHREVISQPQPPTPPPVENNASDEA